MDYKERINKLKKEIVELEIGMELKYQPKTFRTDAEFEMHMNSHMKMVQGPWKRLGIAIEGVMQTSIEGMRNDFGEFKKDYTYEMGVEDALKTSKELCKGFFDTWEKELELLQFNHLADLKKKLEIEAKCLEA